MTIASGTLKKLTAQINTPVDYFFSISGQKIAVNPLLGKKIKICYLHAIYCIQCQRKTNKSFQQGYCFPCYRKLLECNLCIIHPEKCKHGESPCPDTWEHEHCAQEHVVYLANSSGLKVGITRLSQLPTRWIDQGAIQAVLLFRVNNRYVSGLFEVCLKQFIADKTNWRKMLVNNDNTLDMIALKEEILIRAKEPLSVLVDQHPSTCLMDHAPIDLVYPLNEPPNKYTQLNLDKMPEIEGKVIGIKGQYLLLDSGVFNIRKHSGYQVSLDCTEA